ncbi:hypothetical protein R1sor_017481 [Riccia sorocarpa]|uniref:Reverse transcriptase zinc-binding domain-containing protein n=1 Tax=Riccia sorocarpa TaxID=122646 RepID=A0ABD3I8R9_9MARC
MDTDTLQDPIKMERIVDTGKGLLLLQTIPSGKTSTTRHFVKIWLQARPHLRLDSNRLVLPGTLTLYQVTLLKKSFGGQHWFNDRTVFPILKLIGIQTIRDLRSGTASWRDTGQEAQSAGIPLTSDQSADLTEFQSWLEELSIECASLQSSPSWRWTRGPDVWKKWTKPSRFWIDLLKVAHPPEDLTERWHPNRGLVSWADRWRLLWKKKSPAKIKIWIWRILKKGFFTNTRAQKMRIGQGICPRCGWREETITHLMWECASVKWTWDKLRRLTFEASPQFRIRETLLSTIDEDPHGTLLNIIAVMAQFLWKDRNVQVFQGRKRRTPAILALKQTREEIGSSFSNKSNETKWQQGIESLQEINDLIYASTRENQAINDGLTLSLQRIELLLETTPPQTVNITAEESVPWIIANSQTHPITADDGNTAAQFSGDHSHLIEELSECRIGSFSRENRGSQTEYRTFRLLPRPRENPVDGETGPSHAGNTCQDVD